MPHEDFAILFDLDGTLIDSIELLVASMEFAFEGRTEKPPVDRWVSLIGTPLDAMLAQWATGPEDVVALRARYREYQFANHDRMTHAYPGVVETVRALHALGHPMGVVTSKLEYGARKSLTWTGIEECFSIVVGIDSTIKHKPHPEPVEYALRHLHCPASRAIFVGDSTHDMLAGNAAHVATAAALWGPFSRAQLETASPRYWLRDIAELPALIERLA